MGVTKQKGATAVAEYYPSPAGCAAHERQDWLPDLPLNWLRELRARHIELASAWARSVDAIAAARESFTELEVEYRRAVRDAIAVGDSPPARPDTLDPALRDARVSVALEDAEAARDDLHGRTRRGMAQARRGAPGVLPALGDMRLSEVTRADVQDLADRLTAAGLSASTVQNSLDPLRVIFGRAIRRDVLAVDPSEGLELRRPNGRRDRIATPGEAAALLAALSDPDRALWATAMYAGLRRGELRALRHCDIDLAGRVIHVQRGWDDVTGEQSGKSTAATRNVPVLDLLAPQLAAHKLRTGRDGDDLVFGRTAGDAFVPSTVRSRALAAWKAENGRRVKEADDPASAELLAPIGLHEARHTFASLMIAAGANVKVIQSVMGHAAITMTLDTYGHLMPGGLDEAAAAANAYLARLGRAALTLAG